MAWYEASAHFHRDHYKRRKLGGLLGTTTKSVRIILLDGWEGLKAYTLEKGFILQSKGAHFYKNSPPRFARYSMASTLQICFLRL